MALTEGVAGSLIASFLFETAKSRFPEKLRGFIPGFFRSNPTIIEECDAIGRHVISKTLSKFSSSESLKIYLGPEKTLRDGVLNPLFKNIFESGPIPRSKMIEDLKKCSVKGEFNTGSASSGKAVEIVDFIIDEMRSAFRQNERTIGFLAFESINDLKGKLNSIEGLLQKKERAKESDEVISSGTKTFIKAYKNFLNKVVADLRINGVEKASQRDSFRQRLEESYISVQAVPSGGQDILKLEKKGADFRSSVMAYQIVSEVPKLVIRGVAGSGKTTLLQKVISDACNGNHNEGGDFTDVVPLFFPLRRLEIEYVENWTIENCFQQSLEDQSLRGNVPLQLFSDLAECDNVLFLLDGLDEVSEGNRDNFWSLVSDIETRLPEARIIITTRNLSSVHLADGSFKSHNLKSKDAYRRAREQWRPSPEFFDFTLCPLNNEQVSHLIDAWFDGLDQEYVHPSEREFLDKWPAKLKSQLFSPEGTEALRLGRSPLLCALICLVFYLDDGNLPKSRRALYEKATNLLLATRDERRRVRGPLEFESFSLEMREAVLRSIALEMQEGADGGKTQSIETSRPTVLTIIDKWKDRTADVHASSDKILDFLIERCAIIREPALNRVDFVHRSFMEYLAANEIVLNRGAHGVRTRILNDQWASTLAFCMDTPTGGTYFAGMLVSEMVSYVKDVTKGGGRQKAAERRRLSSRIASLLTPMATYPEDFRSSFEFLSKELLPPRDDADLVELLSVPFIYFQDKLSFEFVKNLEPQVQEASGKFLAMHQDKRCASLLQQGYENLPSIELIHFINRSGRVPVPNHYALIKRIKNGSFRKKVFLDADDLKSHELRELISRAVGLRFPFNESKFVGWDFLPHCSDITIQYASGSDWEKVTESVAVRRFDRCRTLELEGCSDFNFHTIANLFPAVENLFINSCRHFSCEHFGHLKEVQIIEFRRVSHPIRINFDDCPTKLSAVHFNSCNSVDWDGDPGHGVDISEGVVAE
jgi:hypothetical protein